MRGIVLMVLAICSFVVLDAIAKYLSKFYPVMMIVWARYFLHVVIMLAIFLPQRGARLWRTNSPRLQWLRGAALAFSSVWFFTSLSLMPLAEASAITLIAPILVTVLAVKLMGETAPPGAVLALALSFAGVLLIVRPGAGVFSWVALFPMVTACFFAMYQLLTRKLAGRDEPITTLFLGAVFGAVMMSAVVPFFWRTPQSWGHVGLFVATGAIGAFGHGLIVRAFSYAPASTLAPYTYVQLVMALMLGWFVFGQFPDGWALVGMALIAATGVVNALLTARRMSHQRAALTIPAES
jgi:drug/metabolite transporter (DMT)-like permease